MHFFSGAVGFLCQTALVCLLLQQTNGDIFEGEFLRDQSEKPGNCPTVEPREECPPPGSLDNECLVDKDCPDQTKCCTIGCNLKCSVANITEKTEVCTVPIDLGFLIDISGSIGDSGFKTIKKFVKSIINAYVIGPEDTHVGAIYYSDDATLLFGFNTFQGNNLTKETLLAEIDAIPGPPQGRTRIDMALRMAERDLFSVRGGVRPEKPKLLLVMTDGRQTTGDDVIPKVEALHIASKTLKEGGTHVYSMGIGTDYDIGELLEIATDDASVFRAASFDQLLTVVSTLTENTCKACTKPVDVHFAIDSSDNMNADQFKMVKNFIARLGEKFVISMRGAHLSASVFSDEAQVVFDFYNGVQKNEFMEAVENIPFLDTPGTAMDKALRLASEQIFQLRGGTRQPVPKVLVLFTTGNCLICKETLATAVQPLKDAGVQVIVLSIGDKVNTAELLEIVSYPKDQYIYSAESFEKLINAVFIQKVSTLACASKPGKCPTTIRPSFCTATITQKCRVDQECPDDQKCCLDGCDRACIPPKLACITPLDISFLFDSSQSIGSQGFELMKDFASNLVDSFQFSEVDSHISAITYGGKPSVAFNFAQFYRAKKIKDELQSISYLDSKTSNLSAALDSVIDNIFSVKGRSRRGVPRVLVVLTNGEDIAPEDEAEILRKAELIKKSTFGSEIVVVAIGDKAKNSPALQSLASKSASVFGKFFSLDSFADLVQYKQQLKVSEEVCSAKVPQFQCKAIPPNPNCRAVDNECTTDFDCPGTHQCCPEACRRRCIRTYDECNNKVDLVLVLDDSQKNTDSDSFLKVKQFAKQFVGAFDVSEIGTHVAAMTFSDTATVAFDFASTPSYNVSYVRNAIDKIPYSGGLGSRLDKALTVVNDNILSAEGGSRDYRAQQAVVIITDGNTAKESKSLDLASWPLRGRLVRIIAISIGDQINEENLKNVVSLPVSENVFLAANYDDIMKNVRELAKTSCRPAFQLPPAPIVFQPGPPGPAGDLGEKGASGPDGNIGDAGLLGELGAKGDFGMKGEKGNQGAAGPPGGSGDNTKGPDPLAPAVGAGELGELSAGVGVYDYRPGAPGPPGPVGKAGEAGESGDGGIVGRVGQIGRDGPTGGFGPRGPAGEPGADGLKGELGELGPIGEAGANGLPGGQGAVGLQGDSGFKGASGAAGEAGDAGDNGRDGSKGYKGMKGLLGDAGPSGEPGKEGVVGPAGPFGLTGARGFQGQPGPPGQVGEDGFPGPNGYQGNRGNKGVQGGAGIRGVKGAAGDLGPIGDQGAKGGRGRAGEDGIEGQAGEKGTKGLIGASGPPGERGAVGERGASGGPGTDGANGIKGESGPAGQTGQRGLKGEFGDGGLPGADGPSGAEGARGSKGLPGIPGPPGAVGPGGLQGAIGETGNPGRQGLKGESGELGFLGALGAKGSRGSPGEIGVKGLRGKTGFGGKPGQVGRNGKSGQRGAPGNDGNVGTPGAQGQQGFPGPLGRVGSSGDQGATGAAGEPGLNGKKGQSGERGRVGQQGLSGPSGKQGLTGEGGPAGVAGRRGLQGAAGPAGATGQNGNTGAAGPKGQRGRGGRRGVQGESGQIGSPGQTGRAGDAGVAGGRGEDGAPGLTGDTGPFGAAGNPGPAGTQGRQGNPGPAGAEGNRGLQGLSGLKGEGGKDGTPGSAGPDGLIGRAGPPGPRGASGADGKPGNPGQPGRPGEVGSPGPDGLAGRMGPQGIIGPTGKPGLPGPKGGVGDSGDEGEAGPDGFVGSSGAVGPIGLVGESGTLGDPGLAGEIGLFGPQGAPGEQGPVGLPGPSGVPGAVGKQGLSGALGDTGVSGKTGPAGKSGSPGKDGVNGLPGDAGKNGADGPPGPSGRSGLQGPVGLPGNPGRTGSSGGVGEKGFPGADGAAGKDGARGRAGKAGAAGAAGDQGGAGEDGAAGSDGKSGQAGSNGQKGESGSRGKMGTPGAGGSPGGAGEPGSDGPLGADGLRGPSGAAGLKGRTGSVGTFGGRGAKGPAGATGVGGMKGAKGNMGRQGIVGPVGAGGSKGDQGLFGPSGPIGLQGSRGDYGVDGPEGPKGKFGETGHFGQRGSQGYPGPPGDAGRNGEPGKPGPAGPAGPPGTFGGSAAGNFIGFLTAGGVEKGPVYRQYRKATVDDAEQAVNKKYDLFKKFHKILTKVDAMRSGKGTIDAPARTCRELFAWYPEKKSDDYFIDPNGGSSFDQFKVYCNKTSMETCIYPKRTMFDISKWHTGKDTYKWAMEDLDAMPYGLEYSSDIDQIKIMQLLSTRAVQNITYVCRNSNAWTLSSGGISSKTIKLRTDDESEFHGHSILKHLQAKLVKDGCKVKDGNLHETVIELKTHKMKYLPIMDMAAYDIGDKDEEFGWNLGPVCFS